MFKKAEWIWAEENDSSSGDCVFRYAFNADKRPKTAEMSVAATGACFVSVNGEYVLYAAGRDATESETFYMTADISRELKKGVNVIVARVAAARKRTGWRSSAKRPAWRRAAAFWSIRRGRIPAATR